MAAGRPLVGLISWVILAGGIVLQFFVVLSGAVSGSPEPKIWFLRSTTNGIPNARNPASWTFFAICGVDANGGNTNCGSPVPALPFDPPNRHDFGTTTGVPQQFIGTSQYYYLSRFMFAFYLVALFFAVIAFFQGALALCSRLGGYLSGMTTMMACFFQLLAAALMTAWTVKGRNVFRSAGQTAELGKYAYGFTWAAAACYLISSALFCIGGSIGGDGGGYGSGRKGMFGRSRSTRSRKSNLSRGSFIDTESQRPMAQNRATPWEDTERSSFERMRRQS